MLPRTPTPANACRRCSGFSRGIFAEGRFWSYHGNQTYICRRTNAPAPDVGYQKRTSFLMRPICFHAMLSGDCHVPKRARVETRSSPRPGCLRRCPTVSDCGSLVPHAQAPESEVHTTRRPGDPPGYRNGVLSSAGKTPARRAVGAREGFDRPTPVGVNPVWGTWSFDGRGSAPAKRQSTWPGLIYPDEGAYPRGARWVVRNWRVFDFHNPRRRLQPTGAEDSWAEMVRGRPGRPRRVFRC